MVVFGLLATQEKDWAPSNTGAHGKTPHPILRATPIQVEQQEEKQDEDEEEEGEEQGDADAEEEEAAEEPAAAAEPEVEAPPAQEDCSYRFENYKAYRSMGINRKLG